MQKPKWWDTASFIVGALPITVFAVVSALRGSHEISLGLYGFIRTLLADILILLLVLLGGYLNSKITQITGTREIRWQLSLVVGVLVLIALMRILIIELGHIRVSWMLVVVGFGGIPAIRLLWYWRDEMVKRRQD